MKRKNDEWNSQEYRRTSNRESTKKRKRVSTGKPYKIVAYLCMCLFVAMIGYMVYFQVEQSKKLLSSPYNQREIRKENNVTRGSVLAADGTVLAETQVAEDGTEIRVYPYGSLFSHVVGYSDYGGSGLEAVQSYRLLESHADLMEQMQNEIEGVKNKGDNVVTTLDVALQQAAYEGLGGHYGAAVVMDALTGEVLASVSNPGFEPNRVAEDWEELNSDESGSPFLNRALQGLYPPGSTFKIITALAYLREHGGFEDFSFECTGTYTQGGFTIHCVDGSVHGAEDFEAAFANSCNCAFSYMITQLMDQSSLKEAAESLLFNSDPDLLLPNAKSRYSFKKGDGVELAMQTAIGQGDTLVTPVQMAMVAQAVYAGGEMMKPGFVRGVINYEGDTVKAEKVQSLGTVMSHQEAAALTELMRGVVNHGTAVGLSDLSYQVAGKTGTAQYGNLEEDTAHSWFVGFSETGDRDIVVAVIVEDGGNGVYPAVPVAKHIFQSRFGN
ncbi:MAG: penicillin-binding transpeptidase domain-containing protein [Lachnospiraceae bacterium]|nr:penicillin-binding transpeptidase domain-containing protein [Lachnospiraceae bacterium]